LAHSLVVDASDIYHKEYKAKSVKLLWPKAEKIRIWVKEVKPGTGNRTYTHVVRVYLPYDSVVIDDKKKIKAHDTFIYAVDAGLLSVPDGGKTEKRIKLINSFHKE
jgi:hypothetical protein